MVNFYDPVKSLDRIVNAAFKRIMSAEPNVLISTIIREAVVSAIEEERAACLAIVDGIYDKLEPGAVSRCGGLLLDAAMDIRARSEQGSG